MTFSKRRFYSFDRTSSHILPLPSFSCFLLRHVNILHRIFFIRIAYFCRLNTISFLQALTPFILRSSNFPLGRYLSQRLLIYCDPSTICVHSKSGVFPFDSVVSVTSPTLIFSLHILSHRALLYLLKFSILLLELVFFATKPLLHVLVVVLLRSYKVLI